MDFTSEFTCLTCRMVFQDADTQKRHHKCEWHRYNLKRKVTDLSPITEKDFLERASAQYSDEQSKIHENLHCQICRRKFSSENQYDNHVVSKKHKDNLIKHEISDKASSASGEDTNGHTSKLDKFVSTIDEANSSGKSTNETDEAEIDSDVESVCTDEWIEDTENPVKNNNCLFCDSHSKSLTRNLKHMMITHSFFIPDPEYCVDMRGLLMYLGDKIFAGYMCIWCNNGGKTFHSAEAARAHMVDKGHCKMLHEGEALMEYADFYDYSSSYPDDEKNGDPDTEVEIPAELDGSDYQLVLPSGNVIGHRSLMRYYKQSFGTTRTVSGIVPKNAKREVLLQYKVLGWTATKKESIVRKVRDMKYMHRVQAKYSTRLQFKANKLQHHFREQVKF